MKRLRYWLDQEQRIAALEQQVAYMDTALALMVQALERMDARIGEWAVEWPAPFDGERDG